VVLNHITLGPGASYPKTRYRGRLPRRGRVRVGEAVAPPLARLLRARSLGYPAPR
jgi:hypothetical protein